MDKFIIQYIYKRWRRVKLWPLTAHKCASVPAMAGPTILLKYNLAPLVLYIKHFGLWSQSACAAVMS